MTKQERAEFTIDYIRNRTEGVPDEFLFPEVTFENSPQEVELIIKK
jgi:hypothetical protein